MKSHSNILCFLHKIGCLKFRDCFGTKGKHTSPTGIDITCTRLSVVFLIRRIEHRFLVSLNFLEENILIATHVKDTQFFYNRWIDIIYYWQPFAFLNYIQASTVSELIFPNIPVITARKAQHSNKGHILALPHSVPQIPKTSSSYVYLSHWTLNDSSSQLLNCDERD